MATRPAYTRNWKQIARRVKEEAGWKCQACGIAHEDTFLSGAKVVLGVAHLDQNRQNNRRDNLRALCQRCHFRYDAAFNITLQEFSIYNLFRWR